MTAKEWLGVMQQAENYNHAMTPLIIKYSEMLVDESHPSDIQGEGVKEVEVLTKEQFVNWFFNHKPCWPTPEQIYDAITQHYYDAGIMVQKIINNAKQNSSQPDHQAKAVGVEEIEMMAEKLYPTTDGLNIHYLYQRKGFIAGYQAASLSVGDKQKEIDYWKQRCLNLEKQLQDGNEANKRD